MILSSIVAMSKNRVIGKENSIPWYLPVDLKKFKKITTDHHIIMGRKCFDSIGKPLPNRTNIVITRNVSFWNQDVVAANSLEQALDIAYQNGEKEVFIIGGGEIYAQSSNMWNKLYLTELDLIIDGDVFFPEIQDSHWKTLSHEEFAQDELNKFDFSIKVLQRI